MSGLIDWLLGIDTSGEGLEVVAITANSTYLADPLGGVHCVANSELDWSGDTTEET